LALIISLIPAISYAENIKTLSYDDGGPPLPDNVNYSVIQGSYIDNSGDLRWEKIEVDPTNSESDNPTYADIYRPGYKHVCGATFLLIATQANWNSTQSQQGSQQTIMDNSGGDVDSRCGAFKISRNNSTEAQDYVYRLWEINAPLGTTALYPVNSYSYNQNATQCNGANEVSTNQNPCVAENSNIPQLSGVVRTDSLYYYPNSSWNPINPINGWNFGAFINYPIPTIVTWEKINADGEHLGNSIWDMVNPTANQSITNIKDCQQQDCDAFQDKDPRSGYFKINSILADGFGTWNLMERQAPNGYELSTNTKQVYLDLWNTNVTYGQIVNQKIQQNPRVTFKKVDSSDNLLAGATFTIANSNVTCAIVDNGAGECRNTLGQVVEMVEDTDKVTGSFNLLLPETGIWTLEETQAPNGYNFSNKHIWTTPNLELNNTHDLANLVNYRQPSMHFTKTDIDTNELIGGASFTISSPNTSFDITDCIAAPCPAGLQNDQDPEAGSIIIENLTDINTTYTISEKTPPVGYFTNSNTLSTTLLQQPMNEFGTIADQHLPQIIWSKVDKDNNSVLLPDSIWQIKDDIQPSGILIHDCDHNNEWCQPTEQSYTDLNPQVGQFRVILDNVISNNHYFAEYSAPPGYQINPPLPEGDIEFSPGGCAVGSTVTLTGNLAQYFPSAQVTVDNKCSIDLGAFTNKRITPTLAWVKTDSIGYPLDNSAWTISSPDLPNYQAGRYIEDYTGQVNYQCQGNTPGNLNLCDLDPRPGYFMITDFYSDLSSVTMNATEITAPVNYALTVNKVNTFTTTCTGGDNQCFFDGQSGITQDAKTGSIFFSNHQTYQSITNLRLPYLAWDKVCDETGQPLKDSQWTLTDSNQTSYSVSDNNSPEGSLVDIDKALGSLMVTLPHDGVWQLQETKAPLGYKRVPNIITITVENENMIYNIADGTLRPNPNISDDLFSHSCEGDFSKNQPGLIICGIPNSANSPTIKWNKTDTNNISLANTQWQLQLIGTDSIGQTNKVYTIKDYSSTTAPNTCMVDVMSQTLCDTDPRPGHFVVPNIPGGSYKLFETIAPNGYQALNPNNLCGVNYNTQQDWCLESPVNKNFITVNNTPEDIPSEVGEFYTIRDDTAGTTRIENTPLPTVAAWEKSDDLHNPIANSIWQVCKSTDWDSINKTCISPIVITDNTGDINYTGLDQNAAPGGFSIILGQDIYLLYEVQAPDGFIQPNSPDPMTFDTTLSQYTWLGVFNNTQYPIINWHKISSAGTTSSDDDFDLTGSAFSLTVNPDVCLDNPEQACQGNARQGEPFNPDGSVLEINNIIDCVATSTAACQNISSNPNQDLDPRIGYYSVQLPPCSMSQSGFTDNPPSNLCGLDGQLAYYWTLTETAAPIGYELSQNPSVITQKQMGQPNSAQPDTSPVPNYTFDNIVNQPIKPTLSFTKLRSDNSCSITKFTEKLDCLANGGNWQSNLPLGEATFEISDNNGNSAIIQDNFGQANYTCTTQGDWLPNICDSDPRPGYFFIANLPPYTRTWTVTEFNAPDGFIIDLTTIDFCAATDESVPNCHVNTILNYNFINDPFLGQLEWQKSDANGQLLGGAVWTLTNSSLGIARQFTIVDNIGQPNYYSTCVDPKTVSDDDLNKGIAICDYDSAAGIFKTINLCMDAWNIEEKQAPSGYKKLAGRLDTLALTYDKPIQTFNNGQPFVNIKQPSPTPTPTPPEPKPLNPVSPLPNTGVELYMILGFWLIISSLGSLAKIIYNKKSYKNL
jgi:hypothetical protein